MTCLRPPAARRIAFCAAVLVASSATAQVATFRNFKSYPPSGEWRTELVGYRNNQALGPPTVTTVCGSLDSMRTARALAESMRGAQSSCTVSILVDTERLAESETLCRVGAGVQTIRTRLQAIDDRTVASETRSTRDGAPETLTKVTATYLGACPAGMAEAQARPSAADCAELAKARQDNAAAGGAEQCAQLPPQSRGRCEAGLRMMETLAQRCR